MAQSFLRVFAAIVLLFPSSLAIGGEKLDPFFSSPQGFPDDAHLKGLSVEGERSVSAFIRSDDPASTAAAISDVGGEVRMIVADLLSISLPRSALAELSSRSEVRYIEAAKPIQVKNDIAMNEINAAEVHQGLDLAFPVTGKGTIIGIVDTGIDLTHADFLDGEGKTRILAVWDQRQRDGRRPKELMNSYGSECDQRAIAAGACALEDFLGHGTHIAGIAAGRHHQFGGVAPEANIIAVNYRSEIEIEEGYVDPLFSTTICEAAYYIFKKAEGLGMPAVVNLSLGTHIGPHDGTSLFEQCLDGLVRGTPGRAIVVAAGNESSEDPEYSGIHAAIDVDGAPRAANVAVRNFQAGRLIYLDIWGSIGSDVAVGLGLRAGRPQEQRFLEQSSMVIPGALTSGSFAEGGIRYEINASETASPLNSKPHIGITIAFTTAIEDPAAWTFDLIVAGKGHLDAWVYPDKPATSVNFTSFAGKSDTPWEFVANDRRMSISVPATAKELIAVGAYATRAAWSFVDDCCQVDFTPGKLLNFSSHGPAVAPEALGVKPELTAPGGMIASAMSHQMIADQWLITPDGEHVLQAGTSMAAPFVAGAVALMFSANPKLTAADVEAILTATAAVDRDVGSVPNDAWGYGKLDVLKAVIAAAEKSGATASASNGAASPSGGGCTLVADGVAADVSLLLMGIFCLAALFWGQTTLLWPVPKESADEKDTR